MKRCLILTLSLAALLTGHGRAITEAQLSAHLAGLFGAVGAKVVACGGILAVPSFVSLCGETARAPADVARAWTAAARAPSEPVPFQATSRWDAGEEPDRATFQAADGTLYLVQLSAYEGTTGIWVIHSSFPRPRFSRPRVPSSARPPRRPLPPSARPGRAPCCWTCRHWTTRGWTGP